MGFDDGLKFGIDDGYVHFGGEFGHSFEEYWVAAGEGEAGTVFFLGVEDGQADVVVGDDFSVERDAVAAIGV